MFVAGLAAKLAGATFYAAVIALYLRYVDSTASATTGERSSRDVFHWLTYRQRYEKARSQMARDALTGLYNRGYFDEHAPRQVAHAERANHMMSLVLIDVDNLKATNDRHGHRPATSCCASSPTSSTGWCGPPTPPAATAATSSSWC